MNKKRFFSEFAFHLFAYSIWIYIYIIDFVVTYPNIQYYSPSTCLAAIPCGFLFFIPLEVSYLY